MPDRTNSLTSQAALLSLAAGLYVFWWLLPNLSLGPQIGSITELPPRMALYWVAASAVMVLPWLLLARALPARPLRIAPWLPPLIVMLSALAWREWVTLGVALTDDESIYLYAANLLSEGRLTEDSPAFKSAYDRVFLINDGRMFTQYYLGWPAVLVPFAWTGTTWAAVPLIAAALTVLIRAVLRPIAGENLASVGALALMLNPLSLSLAAGFLSHIACATALLAAIYAFQRWCEAPSTRWAFAMGLAVAVATWIRPTNGAAIGLVLGAGLLMHWRRLDVAQLLAGLLAPLALGALFIATNIHLYGGVLGSGYESFRAYEAANGYPSTSPAFGYAAADVWARLTSPSAVVESALAGAGRLLSDGAFAVVPLLALGLVWAGRQGAVLLASAVVAFLPYVALRDFGIDSYGPAHLYEVWLLLFMAAIVGWHRRAGAGPAVAIVAAAFLVTATSWACMRTQLVRTIAEEVRAPLALADAVEGKLLVFYYPPFTPQISLKGQRHFVFWPPMHLPGRNDRVLWVRGSRQKSVDQDLADSMPEREPLYLRYRLDGTPALLTMRGEERTPDHAP